DEALRLRGDGAEDERALARSRHAREDGEPALGDLDAYVLQVVLAGPLDPDQVVGVRRMARHQVRTAWTWVVLATGLPSGSVRSVCTVMNRRPAFTTRDVPCTRLPSSPGRNRTVLDDTVLVDAPSGRWRKAATAPSESAR